MLIGMTAIWLKAVLQFTGVTGSNRCKEVSCFLVMTNSLINAN